MVDERNTEFTVFMGSVAANTLLPAQQMRLNTDGPFCLREIAVYGSGGSLISGLGIKFQDARGAFVEQDFIGSLQEIPYAGNGPVITPVVPQQIYPPNGNIVVYIQNLNPAQSISNLRVVFRGVTLFPGGSILNRQDYPQFFREIPYNYPLEVVMAVSPFRDNILNIKPDADFAFRALSISQPGPGFNSFIGSDVEILLKDQFGKYYEIPAAQPNSQTLDGVFVNTLAGESEASRPGVFVPEIYLKANNSLYFDLIAPAGLLPLTLWVSFKGSKVFPSNTP